MPPSSADSSARAPRAASPWAHVVRGASEDAPAASASPPPLPAAAPIADPEAADRDRDAAGPSDSSDDSNGKGKRTAWGLPANGAMDVGPVMGAASWPALGESSKGITIKSASDGSSSLLTPPPVPGIANHNPNHHQMRVITNNPNPNSNRPKPNKRGGGGDGSTGSNHGSQFNGMPVSPPQPPALSEMPTQIVPEKLAGNGHEHSSRDMHNSRNHSNWDHVSSSKGNIGVSPRSHGGSDHHRPLNRRGNNGGPHNGGRRDPDRVAYSNHSNDWNNPPPRHIPPPPPRLPHHRPQFIRAPPPPPPPPPGAVPFIGPSPPVRPFVGPPMGFPADISSPVFYVPGPPPFIAAAPVAHAMAPAIILNHVDSLRPAVLKQIEYYFSNDNLCKDVYLRGLMDAQGWIPVDVIADFNRVKSLTRNIPDSIKFILDVVRTSEVVEEKDEKIRKRHGWMNWVLQAHAQPIQHSSTLSPRSPAAVNSDSMADRIQHVMLEDRPCTQITGGTTISEVGRLTSGNFVDHLQVGGSNQDKVCTNF